MSLKVEPVIAEPRSRIFHARQVYVVRTDNGPPFYSYAFKQFEEKAGFTRIYLKTTPLHPMSNAIVERFIQPLQKEIKTAIASGKNYQLEQNEYLLNYRNTLHTVTKLALLK
jgi:transposase InsO family protein